jgi:hypothetical protein
MNQMSLLENMFRDDKEKDNRANTELLCRFPRKGER